MYLSNNDNPIAGQLLQWLKDNRRKEPFESSKCS